MQSVRTAGQKQLAKYVSPLGATWVRYGFGLPFAMIYCMGVWRAKGSPRVTPSAGFWCDAILASAAQIVATVLLVRVLTLRNFAVGTTYAKTEAILTAILSTMFFGVVLHWSAWLSVLIGFAGVAVVSVQRSEIGLKNLLTDRAMFYGLGAGLGFAITSLLLRRASLSLRADYLLSAAVTLVTMVAMQTAIAGLLLLKFDRACLAVIIKSWRLCTFVGATSAAGSAGWFTAMTFQDAAYVKALGQVEFVITIFITYLVFRERISHLEWVGMVLIVAAVLALTL